MVWRFSKVIPTSQRDATRRPINGKDNTVANQSMDKETEAPGSVDKENENLKAELDNLRKDLGRLSDQVGKTAGAGARAASDETRAEINRLRSELNRLSGYASEHGKATADTVHHQVEQHPLASLATAFGVGFLLGKLLDRR